MSLPYYRLYTITCIDLKAFGTSEEKRTLANSNPLRFSSEYHDDDLGLIYYNYHHYNPKDGRWISRDFLGENFSLSNYEFLSNNSVGEFYVLGLYSWGDFGIYVASAALIAADLALGGPTGEGIAPALALQATKTGTKAAAKKEV